MGSGIIVRKSIGPSIFERFAWNWEWRSRHSSLEILEIEPGASCIHRISSASERGKAKPEHFAARGKQ